MRTLEALHSSRSAAANALRFGSETLAAIAIVLIVALPILAVGARIVG
jgi:hypothetical protein